MKTELLLFLALFTTAQAEPIAPARACTSPLAALTSILSPGKASCITSYCSTYLLRTTTSNSTITPSTTSINTASVVITTVTITPAALVKRDAAALSAPPASCPSVALPAILSPIISSACSCVVTASTSVLLRTSTVTSTTITVIVPSTQTRYVPEATQTCGADPTFALQISSGPPSVIGRLLGTRYYTDDSSLGGQSGVALGIADSPTSFAIFRKTAQYPDRGVFSFGQVNPATGQPVCYPNFYDDSVSQCEVGTAFSFYYKTGNFDFAIQAGGSCPLYCTSDFTCYVDCGANGRNDFSGGLSISDSVLFGCQGQCGGDLVTLSMIAACV